MEQYCRTCGKTVDTIKCINIFSPMGRRLLRCVRTIANCWVENVAGFPVYLCQDCQSLLKKIDCFRKRCAKIEAYLIKRKPKLAASNEVQTALTETKFTDPLQIEEPQLDDIEIKTEPVLHHTQIDDGVEDQIQAEIDQMSNDFYEDPPASDVYTGSSFYDDLDDSATANAANVAVDHKPNQISNEPTDIDIVNKKRKYSMRVGKRTMYIKMTDDKQPKRIVDRERQWASARPCICEHCGRQFKDGSNLNVHLLRHTGTKNYECKLCNEKCYTLHLLRRHQLKHTEGPHKCSFCGLVYSTNSSRVRHEREACKKGRAPQSKTELIKRGERTFYCDVCDLWFLRAGNLTQHINSTNHIANERRKNKRLQMKQRRNLSLDVR